MLKVKTKSGVTANIKSFVVDIEDKDGDPLLLSVDEVEALYDGDKKLPTGEDLSIIYNEIRKLESKVESLIVNREKLYI